MYSFEDFGTLFEEGELPSGSSVRLFRKKGAPIHIRAVVRAGSRLNDVPGTAHFLEHMLVAGTRKFPAKNLLAEAIERTGGSFDAYTGPDILGINIQIARKDDIAVAADILNEMLCYSLMSEEIFESERSAILSEIRRKKANPTSCAMDMFINMAYPSAEMSFLNLGTEETVANMQLATVRSFYEKYFSARSTQYIICGDVSLDEVVHALSVITLPDGVDNSMTVTPVVQTEKRIIIEQAPLKETHLILGFRTDVVSSKEMAGLFIIRNLLAVGRSSLLLTELRYKRGLVYGCDAPLWFLNGTGILGIGASCLPEKADLVLKTVSEVLQSLFDDGISEDVLAFTKEKLLKSRLIEMQTSSSWVAANTTPLTVFLDKKVTMIDVMNEIEKMMAGEVSGVFRKYIRPDSSYLAVYGAEPSIALKPY